MRAPASANLLPALVRPAATPRVVPMPSRSGARSPERIGSPGGRSRTASSSGARAPERWMRLCTSGSMTGSSQGPCTMNGSSNEGTPALALPARLDSRLAVPLRSRSRAGIEAEPPSATRTAGPSMRTSSTVAVPWLIFRLTVSELVGRLAAAEFTAARKRPALDAPEQLLDIEPGDRALAAGQVGGAVQRLGQLVDAGAELSSAKASVPLPSRRRIPNISPRQRSRSTSENCSCALKSAPACGSGDPERALQHAAEGLRLSDRHAEIAAAQRGGDRGAAEPGMRRR